MTDHTHAHKKPHHQKITKKDVTRMGKEITAEAAELKADYIRFMKEAEMVTEPTLILVCIVSAALVIFFASSFLDFVGLAVFAWALYAIASRRGHREGYIDGHFGMMKEASAARADGPSAHTAGK